MRKKEKPWERWIRLFMEKHWQYFLGINMVLLSLLISIGLIFYFSLRPWYKDKALASRLAKQEVGLASVASFDYFNDIEGYYSLSGKTEAGQLIYVVVDQDSQSVLAFDPASGKTKEEVTQLALANGSEKVGRIIFGLYDNNPVWRVQAGKTTYLFNFTDGNLIKKEEL